MRHILLRACAVSLLLPAVLWAGKVTMKDGTVYEGTVKAFGTGYSIKMLDGTTKYVTGEKVASVDDDAAPAGGTGGVVGGGIAGKTAPGAATPSGGADFDRTVRQADRVDTPLIAVTLWQKFVDTHPTGPDNAAGKKELARWEEMAKVGGERINGKWVVGDDLKKLHDKVDKLITDAYSDLQIDQTSRGVKKLEEVLKIYPNSFRANFEMGYYNLKKITRVEGSNAKIDASIKSLETAVKLQPNSAAALSNLAIAYNFRRRFEESAVTAFKAAQIEDSTPIIQNLVNALNYAPPGMRANNPRVKPIIEEAALMASRRGISPNGGWTYVRPTRPGGGGGDEDSPGGMARKGIIGSGTGFFISADGYIMTNRHVAAGADKMIIRLSDGTQKVAEKIVVDDDQDIAILKIVPDKKEPYPFIRLASYDAPNIGTDVTVMGFPLGAAMGMHVKITRGVVTSVEDGKAACDVIVDAQVNPGNSGGPMLDKYGNLMALVAMKTMSDEAISSYGLGISTKRLRTFMEHQKEKLTSVKFEAPAKTVPTAALSTEEIAQKFTKATVMILMVSGELPEGLK